ncbi:hypothetical protein [Arthrobacter sp. HY1533]|uniref:hypothetical protein n=1 Tax=Arthrobacter sp. HY1533 TaxID=2970919 RepID=UPI0022B9F602|nr:hypothetical protein [Arthrobacter sp. HY1533]
MKSILGDLMKWSSVSLVTASGLALLLLSGCSGQTGITALDRDATPEDALPAFITVPDPANRESARLLATRDGVRYFVAESDDSKTACLAVVPPGEPPNWVMGCGPNTGPGEILETTGAAMSSARLLADDSETEKLEPGWTKVTENILVRDP